MQPFLFVWQSHQQHHSLFISHSHQQHYSLVLNRHRSSPFILDTAPHHCSSPLLTLYWCRCSPQLLLTNPKPQQPLNLLLVVSSFSVSSSLNFIISLSVNLFSHLIFPISLSLFLWMVSRFLTKWLLGGISNLSFIFNLLGADFRSSLFTYPLYWMFEFLWVLLWIDGWICVIIDVPFV